MTKFDEMLFEYCDTFGENFPFFEHANKTQAEIYEIMADCIKRGKPVETDPQAGTEHIY